MWTDIALTACLSGICSVLFIKLSGMAYEPENEAPFYLKAVGVIWLFSSGISLAVAALFLIWQ